MADTIVVRGVVATAGSHRGFRFEDSSVDSACVISYCRIQDAVEAVYCLNASMLITNSLFTNNSSNGVRCFGASPTVSYCTFVENRQSAITANVGSSPIIENNMFARNNSQNTGARNQIAIGGQGTNNPIIRYNEIYNQSYFRAGGISLLTLGPTDACNALVENNYIHDNSFGIVVQGLSAGGTLRPTIRNNRIENNRINPDSMNSGSGIAVYTGGPSNAPIITGNTIKENYWGITCVSSSGLGNSPNPNLGDLSSPDTSDDGWNIFINNNNGGRIYQLYNNGTQDISAQNNYWGSSDSVMIESWITHRPDSAAFGLVNYKPFGQPGLGQPDSFVVRRINTTTLQLQWSFPYHWPSSTLRLDLSTNGGAAFMLVAFLPDTQHSFTMPIGSPPSGYLLFRLSATNRFGSTSDTTGFVITEVQERSGTPPEYSLEQNYPNPFNPTTTIGYSLPSQSINNSQERAGVGSYVTLKVYDVLGREVATLLNEVKQPGTYTVQWDAANVASGVYLYRLIAGEHVLHRKMLLLR